MSVVCMQVAPTRPEGKVSKYPNLNFIDSKEQTTKQFRLLIAQLVERVKRRFGIMTDKHCKQ